MRHNKTQLFIKSFLVHRTVSVTQHIHSFPMSIVKVHLRCRKQISSFITIGRHIFTGTYPAERSLQSRSAKLAQTKARIVGVHARLSLVRVQSTVGQCSAIRGRERSSTWTGLSPRILRSGKLLGDFSGGDDDAGPEFSGAVMGHRDRNEHGQCQAHHLRERKPPGIREERLAHGPAQGCSGTLRPAGGPHDLHSRGRIGEARFIFTTRCTDSCKHVCLSDVSQIMAKVKQSLHMYVLVCGSSFNGTRVCVY